MPRISGLLRTVTDRPDSVVSVGVRAAKTRGYSGGIVTAQTEAIPVENGYVEFELLPGPAVMALQHVGFGRPTTLEAIPLLVGDTDIDLEAAAAAGAAVDGKTAEELGALQEQIGQWVSKTAEHMRAAEKSAQDAQTARNQITELNQQVHRAQETVMDTANTVSRLKEETVAAADNADKSATNAHEAQEATSATAREVTIAVVQAQDQIQSLTTLSKQTTKTLADITTMAADVEKAARRAEDAAEKATADGVHPEEVEEVRKIAADAKNRWLSDGQPKTITDVENAIAQAVSQMENTIHDVSQDLTRKADSSVIAGMTQRLEEMDEKVDGAVARVESVEKQTWQIHVVSELPDDPAPYTWYAVVDDA